MDIVYHEEPGGNFGDDLNRFIWPNFFSSEQLQVEGIALVGIGSILNEQTLQSRRLAGKRVFILGAGAGYGRIPSNVKSWNVLAVRGPLTASLLGMPGSSATDGAALLSDIFPCSGRESKAVPRISFIPHHKSIRFSRWPEVCSAAGVRFIDPRTSTQRVLTELRSSDLVLAEAMHGAIVSDALGIPWVPLVISPATNVFKWQDWALSLSIPYDPIFLPPSSFLERVRYSRMANRRARSRALKSVEQQLHMSPTELVADFTSNQISSPSSKSRDLLLEKASSSLPIPIWVDRNAFEAAVEALVYVKGLPGTLSCRRVFGDRVSKLRDAIVVLKNEL